MKKVTMNTSTMGVVSAAILMFLGVASMGIAQAAGNHSARPVWSLDEQIETGNLTEPAMESQSQISGPIETGNLTEMGSSDSSIVEIDGVSFYSYGGKLYGPP